MLRQVVDTWQDDTIVYNQACEKKGEHLVNEVSICKLGPAHHSRGKVCIQACTKHVASTSKQKPAQQRSPVNREGQGGKVWLPCYGSNERCDDVCHL